MMDPKTEDQEFADEAKEMEKYKKTPRTSEKKTVVTNSPSTALFNSPMDTTRMS